MAKDFQDIQQLSSEENDHPFHRGEGPGPRGLNLRRGNPSLKGPPPAQPLAQRLCSMVRFSLLALSFNILLLVAICVIGSQSEGHRGAQLQADLRSLKETFSNFSSSTLMEVHALGTHGGSVGDKITSLGDKLEKQQQDLKADHDILLLHLKHFPVDLRFVACQMELLHSNGRGGAVSRQLLWLGEGWAWWRNYCQLENCKLPSCLCFQKFIVQHTNPFNTWIGLTDSDGSWKWVDGTDYRHNYKNWAVTQPDDWHGHELGGSEDCVEVWPDGRWNDDFCLQVHRWVCEKRRNATGEAA
uniref:Asialoglycoprotein receptor 2 n=1 Tax=Papio anubis TaxID=9555 RepID=A0A2I3LEN2_PAPAN